MKASHFIVPAKIYKAIEELVFTSYGHDSQLLDKVHGVNLSEKAITKKAEKLYTTHSIIGNNTHVNGISIEGYKQCAKDIIHPEGKKIRSRFYYQPEFNDYGKVIGHEQDTCFSFQVWHKKSNLLKAFPKCLPLQYQDDDIEEPTFMD